MKKKLAAIVGALYLIGMVSCEKKVGKLPQTVAPVPQNACDTITYEKHIKPIFTANCAFCHTPGPGTFSSGIDLSTYATLKSKITSGALRQRVIVDLPPNSMPKGSNSRLPQEQLNLIQCWIDNGGKEK